MKNGKMTAIKCMKSTFESEEQVNNLREIQALRRLSPHPGIIKLIEVLYEQVSDASRPLFPESLPSHTCQTANSAAYPDSCVEALSACPNAYHFGGRAKAPSPSRIVVWQPARVVAGSWLRRPTSHAS